MQSWKLIGNQDCDLWTWKHSRMKLHSQVYFLLLSASLSWPCLEAWYPPLSLSNYLFVGQRAKPWKSKWQFALGLHFSLTEKELSHHLLRVFPREGWIFDQNSSKSLGLRNAIDMLSTPEKSDKWHWKSWERLAVYLDSFDVYHREPDRRHLPILIIFTSGHISEGKTPFVYLKSSMRVRASCLLALFCITETKHNSVLCFIMGGWESISVYLSSELHYCSHFGEICFIPPCLHSNKQTVSSNVSLKEYKLCKPLLYFSEFSHYFHWWTNRNRI